MSPSQVQPPLLNRLIIRNYYESRKRRFISTLEDGQKRPNKPFTTNPLSLVFRVLGEVRV